MATEKTYLLLVGRTGNGKSATGNSILGREVFSPTRSREIQVTASHFGGASFGQPAYLPKVVVGSGTEWDDDVTVVDGSGIGDTETEFPCDAATMIRQATEALNLLENQFTALLILLRYNDQFIQQEINSLKVIKSIFGPDVISNYGIIVMTGGDNFEADMEDNETTFEDWCGSQEGEIHSILQECNQRCILFNNMTEDPDKLKEQYDKMMIKVKEIKSNCRPYDDTDFASAERGRRKLLVMNKLPLLEKKTNDFVASVDARLPKNVQIFDIDSDQMSWLQELKKILKDMVGFRQWLMEEDECTGFIQIYGIGNKLNAKIARIHNQIAQIENMVKPNSLTS